MRRRFHLLKLFALTGLPFWLKPFCNIRNLHCDIVHVASRSGHRQHAPTLVLSSSHSSGQTGNEPTRWADCSDCVGEVRRIDDKLAEANRVANVAIDLSTARADFIETRVLEWVAESHGSLRTNESVSI